MRSRQARVAGDGDDEDDFDFEGAAPRKRATLHESEAEELRQRLDALLAELGRHDRPGVGALMRRPAVITAVALAAVAVAMAVMWRQHRRSVG